VTRPQKATAIAFLTSPWIPAIIAAVGFPITNESFVADLPNRLLLTPFLAAYSYAATFFLAVPAYLALSRFGLVNVWSILAAGILGGVAVHVILRAPNGIDGNGLLQSCSAGLCGALVFWLIWRTGHKRGNA